MVGMHPEPAIPGAFGSPFHDNSISEMQRIGSCEGVTDSDSTAAPDALHAGT